MEPETARSYVAMLYRHLLGRAPGKVEEGHWTERLRSGMPEHKVFEAFTRTPEFLQKHKVKPGHPPGHFYSPIVDPEAVRDYWAASFALRSDQLPGIRMPIGRMDEFWRENLDLIRSAPFTHDPGGETRYHQNCGNFPKADAVLLMAMIGRHRPARSIPQTALAFPT